MNSRTETPRVRQPFPGLRPFEPDENTIFFGRGEQIDELLAKLENHRFVAVVGASGSGKSSLVRAGLLPSLEAGFLSHTGTDWNMVLMRPGQSPFSRLAAALFAATNNGETDSTAVAFIEATLRSGPRGLVEAIQDAGLPIDTHVLVLVDQFEEIFRFRHHQSSHGETAKARAENDDDRNDATAFVNMLLATSKCEKPVYIVLTMRSDFLGDCDAFHGLPEAINDCQFLVPRLRRDQVRETIVGPLQMVGARAEEGLINRILNEIGSNPDQLPLMQHLLLRMWTRERQVPGELLLETSDYLAVGGLENALSHHADEAFEELPDSETKRVAELLFRCLCDFSDDTRSTRRLATIGEIAAVAGGDTAMVIVAATAFLRSDRSFLISSPPGELTPSTTLDISHEALIRRWSRLSEWVISESRFASWYRRLLESARLRNAGTASLMISPELEIAIWWRDNQKPTEAWAARYGGDFKLSMEFLDDSIADQRAQAERKRLEARRRTILLVTTLAVVSSLMIVAVFLWRRSHMQAVELNDLFAESQISLGTAAAREGRLSDGLVRYWSAHEKTGLNPAARQSVVNLIASWSAVAGEPLMHDGGVIKAVFSQNGESVLTLTDDVAQLWDVSTGYPQWDFESTELDEDSEIGFEQPGRIQAGEPPWSAIDVCRDGTLVLIARNDVAQVWDLSTGKPVGKPMQHSEAITVAFFSDDGTTVVTRGEQYTQLWNAQARDPIGHQWFNKGTCFAVHPNGQTIVEVVDGVATRINVNTGDVIDDPNFGPTQLLVFSPDGKILVQVNSESCLLRNATTLDRLDVAALLHEGVKTIAFSPDSRVLITGSQDNTAKLWETATATQIGLTLQHFGTVLAAVFSADGKTVLTGSSDNSAMLWDATTGESLSYPLRHMGSVESVAFSPDGRTILTGSIGGGARLWQIPRERRMSRSAYGNVFHLAGTNEPPHTFDFTNCANVPPSSETDNGAKTLGLVEKQQIAALSADGSLMLTHDGSTLRLVDAKTRQRESARYEFDSPVVAASFGPRGESILVAMHDSVVLLETHNPAAPRKEFFHPSRILTAAISPDGRLVAIGGTNNKATIWDIASGKPAGNSINHLDDVLAIAFSPDSRIVATGSADDTVAIRKIAANELSDVRLAHYDAVTDVMFSFDGQTLITASDDKNARFWDVFSGEIRGDPMAHAEQVKAARLSRDGRWILTIDDKGDARLWDVVLPAINDSERLLLSIECRSGVHIESDRSFRRLTQREWLQQRLRLDALGGPCDVRRWEELSEQEKKQVVGE